MIWWCSAQVKLIDQTKEIFVQANASFSQRTIKSDGKIAAREPSDGALVEQKKNYSDLQNLKAETKSPAFKVEVL